MTEDEIEIKVFSPLLKKSTLRKATLSFFYFLITRKVKPSPDGKMIKLLTLDDLFPPL